MSSLVTRSAPKRRRATKGMSKPKLVRSVRPQDRVHRFVRTCSTNDGGSNVANISLRTDALGKPTFYANGLAVSSDSLQFVFSLSSFDVYFGGLLTSTTAVPGFAEFTSLYDEWCIEKVEIFAMPTFSNNGIVAGSSAAQLPWIVYAEDNDDNNAASCTALQQYAGAKYTQLVTLDSLNPKPLCVLHPKPSTAMYRSSTGFAYGRPKGNVWIDAQYSTTPHYGMKWALDDSYAGYNASTTIGVVNVVAKIHYAFRGAI